MQLAGVTLPRDVPIEPVVLRAFWRRHNVSQAQVEGVVAQGMLHPITGEDGMLLLDEDGQRAFWQLFHNYSRMWRSCPDCPHGGKEYDLEAQRRRFTKK
jgi:hypothetical protein